MWKALLLSLCCAATAWGLLPSQVAVVYNADSAFSESCARSYCAKRGIDSSQMVALRGIKGGDISRADFDRLIKNPLLYSADHKNWRWPAQRLGGSKEMLAMVLMPDIPLRVKESPAVIEKRRQKAEAIKKGEAQGKVEWTPDEAACVDSELALLGANYPLHSALENPFYSKEAALADARPPVMAVCRIDGPDEATVRRMIEDPVKVERTGLWGWVVIDEGGPYAQGEKMFRTAAMSAQKHHQPLFYETSKKTLANSFPLMGQTAVYFGWYEYRANGPFGPKAADFRFAPGAVAGHLHSFSCENCKDSAQWAPALLKRGAAVSMGNVYEPFLAGCHDFGVFYDRLLKGYCVAEASLMATPLISWQEVTFGDPLYRPFAAQKRGQLPSANPYARWREMAERCYNRPEAMEPLVRAELGKADAAFFAESFAFLCAENKKYNMAAEYFRMAGNASSKSADKLRNRLMQITLLHIGKDDRTAKEMMLNTLAETANSPYRPAVERTAETVIPKEWAEMKKNEEQKNAQAK